MKKFNLNKKNFYVKNLVQLDLEIKTKNFDLIKKIMKKFKKQCDSKHRTSNI